MAERSATFWANWANYMAKRIEAGQSVQPCPKALRRLANCCRELEAENKRLRILNRETQKGIAALGASQP